MSKTPANAPKIGRFVLSHRLGRDSFATIYRAQDPRLKTDVAVRLLHAKIDADSVIQKIQDQQLDQIRHPAVCALQHVGKHQGLAFLAYELVEGPSLAEVLADNGVRSGARLATIRSLLEGFATLHSQSICHLGLTPARITINAEGMPKILSLGRNLLLEAAGDTATVKRSELRYMAPEQFSRQATDMRTDVFRLSLVLFEVACGKPAIRAGKVLEIRDQAKNLDPPANALGQSVDALKLMAFLRQGLRAEPAARYPDCTRMLEVFDKVFPAPTPAKSEVQNNDACDAEDGSDAITKTQKFDLNRRTTVVDSATETEPALEDTDTASVQPSAQVTDEAELESLQNAEPKPEPEAESQAEQAVETEAESQTESKAGPGVKPEAESQTESKAEPDVKPEAEATAEPTAESRANDSSIEVATQPLDPVTATSSAQLSSIDEAGQKTIDYILDCLEKRNDFPVLSQSIFEINKLTAMSANTTVSQIADVILNDYALSNKLLTLANSAYYGVRVEVTRVTDAIRLLGYEQVRITANGLAYTAKLDDSMGQLRDAMLKSFASGLVSRKLAEDLKNSDSEEAFLCAMFHDTGEHLILHYMPDEHARIQRALASDEQATRDSTAQQILGLKFASLGAAVGRSWNFPESIVTAIEGQTAQGEELEDQDLLQLSWIARSANALCDLGGRIAPDDASQDLEDLAAHLKEHINLDVKQMRDILYEVAEKARTYAPVLGIEPSKSEYMQALGLWGPAEETAGEDEGQSEPEQEYDRTSMA